MADITDKVARTIEDTKSFVDTAGEKMDKASTLLDENTKLANQAMKDYQEAIELLKGAKEDVAKAISTISDGVDAARNQNVPGIVVAAVDGFQQVVSAISKYTQAVSDVRDKIENYKKAVEKNKEVLSTF
jgi:uncharacterized phage infection (PIP) family protein YhgE